MLLVPQCQSLYFGAVITTWMKWQASVFGALTRNNLPSSKTNRDPFNLIAQTLPVWVER